MTLQGVSATVVGYRYSPVSRICAHPSGEMCARRLCHRRAGDIQRPKHARRAAPEPTITLHDMGQGIGLDRIGQLRGYGHEPFERTPAAGQPALFGCDELVLEPPA